MGYVGTTAASSVQNPPIQIARGLAGGVLGSSLQGTGVWFYSSTDLSSVASTANYFTDGLYLGMRQGDMVLGVHQSSPGSTVAFAYQGVITNASTLGCNLSTAATQTSSQ